MTLLCVLVENVRPSWTGEINLSLSTTREVAVRQSEGKAPLRANGDILFEKAGGPDLAKVTRPTENGDVVRA